MKKVLFATTALVASAGIASAEVAFKGSAEMGIFGGDRHGNDDAQFHNDFTLSVDGSSETDNGLTFGFHIEFEEDNGAGEINGGYTGDNERVFISGNFGTLTLGEIDGAFDKVLQETALAAGSIQDDETEHDGFNGNSGLDGSEDNQILRYDYSFDALSFALSLEQDDNGDGSDDIYGVGVKYEADFSGTQVTFALGYQSNSVNDLVGVSVDAELANGFAVAVNYSDLDGYNGNDSHYGIGIGYTMDAWAFGINYGEFDKETGDDISGYGLAVNYDLGGGASVQFGYGDDDNDQDSYSLGLAMSF